jgi:hypothetical protein
MARQKEDKESIRKVQRSKGMYFISVPLQLMRKLGWGWTPATRQGWLVILLYIAGILFFAFRLEENTTDKEAISTFVVPLVFFTAILIFIAYKKGEKPKWQFGSTKKEQDGAN